MGDFMPSKHHHHRKKESLSNNSQTLFKSARSNSGHDATQTVNVTVNVDERDDCITSCFKGLAGVFKKK